MKWEAWVLAALYAVAMIRNFVRYGEQSATDTTREDRIASGAALLASTAISGLLLVLVVRLGR